MRPSGGGAREHVRERPAGSLGAAEQGGRRGGGRRPEASQRPAASCRCTTGLCARHPASLGVQGVWGAPIGAAFSAGRRRLPAPCRAVSFG